MLKHKIKLVIICPSHLPVPAVDGGAIETLIQNFIDQNEIKQQLNIILISKFSKNAYEVSHQYKFCEFIWMKNSRMDFVFKLAFMLYNFINRILHINKIPISIDSENLKKIIKSLNYDFVLIEGNGFQLHHLKELVPKRKLVFHIHSFHHCTNNSLNKYLMSLPNKIIAVSGFIKNSLIDNLSLNENSILVLKNCVGNQFFEESRLIEMGVVVDRNKTNFVFTGRIVKEKGIIELVRALSKLKNIGNWHLHIVGSFGSSFGSNGQKNKDNLAKENEIKNELSKIDGFYTIHGYIKNKLIPNLYKNFDLAFSPSICKDAAPLVICEYICSSIPVIASDQGGIPEYLNKDCGVIVSYDKNFVNNLSNAISDFLKNPLLLESMSKSCVEQKNIFSAKEYYSNFLNIFESI